MMLVNMLEGRFISEYDYEIAARIATVLCGGDVDRGSLVDEEWLLKAGAPAFRRTGADAEDPGAHRAHAQDRQAAPQLSRRRRQNQRETDMSKQIQDAYIVAATRTPVGKAPKGVFRNTRPDDMLAHVLRSRGRAGAGHRLSRIDDAIIGCAMPEGEQGMNVARIGVLLAGLPQHRRRADHQPLLLVGPAGRGAGRRPDPPGQCRPDARRRHRVDVDGADDGQQDRAWHPACSTTTTSPSPTAWASLRKKSPRNGRCRARTRTRSPSLRTSKALAAIAAGEFRDEISPYEVMSHMPDLSGNTIQLRKLLVETDEGPRPDTSLEGLAKLRTVFRNGQFGGTVTAGNSSQMSDGAAGVLLASEQAIKDYGLTPLARFVCFSVAGVPPEVMGIGPIAAIPKALKQAGLTQDQLDWIELNEAFAAQALAVIRDCGPGSGQGQSAGRRHRAGPSARRDRRRPHGDHRPRHAPAPAEVRHGDHVHRHRHGRGGHVRIALSTCAQERKEKGSQWLPFSISRHRRRNTRRNVIRAR